MPLAKATRQHIDKVADSAATLQLASEEAARRLTAPVIARASDKLVAGVAVMPLETRSQVMRAAARSIREAQVQLQQEFGAAVLEARSIAAHFASRQLALEAEPLGAEAAHALALTPALPASEVEAMWAQQAGASMARRFGSLAIAETMAAHAKGRGGPGILRALGRVHQRLEPERKLHAVTQSAGAFNEAKREGWNQLNKGLAKARPALPSGGSRAGRRAGGAGGDNGLREVWSAILDARTCPVCWKLDGHMVRPGESFPEDAKAPLHGHCFPPGEQVLGPDGYRAIESIQPGDVVFGGLSGLPRRVLRNNVRQYDGLLVRVTTADGAVLTMTSDHPVLTRSGWLEASKLRVSDELFSQISQLPVLGRDPVPREAHDSPTVLEQESVLGSVGSDVGGGVVPMAGINFDGDTHCRDGEVNVENAQGHLRHNLEALSDEDRQEHALNLARFADLGASFRLVSLGDERVWLAPERSVRGGGESLALGGAGLAHAHKHCGRAASDGHAVSIQDSADGLARATEASGDGLFGNLVNDVERDDQIAVDLQGRDHQPDLMPLSGVSNPIVAIEMLSYRGPVYNFAVEVEESFQVASAIVHNCRCTVITIHIPVELERYLPGAELDYDALKDDIKEYMGSRSFDVGTGVRHAQRYVDDVLKQRGHSPVVLTERVNNRRDYFPNIARPTAPSLRW